MAATGPEASPDKLAQPRGTHEACRMADRPEDTAVDGHNEVPATGYGEARGGFTPATTVSPTSEDA